MKIFVTADQHFGHANIIRLCDRKTGITVGSRQFEGVHEMNQALTQAYNSVVGVDDLCYLLGDFCFKNKSGDARTYAATLNGQKVFIEGNHDKGNKLPTRIRSLTLDHGGVSIGMAHRPEHYNENVDVNLCGHVHGAWTHTWKGENYEHLIINVGVDVNNYRPMSLDQAVALAHHVKMVQSSRELREEHVTSQQEVYHGVFE